MLEILATSLLFLWVLGLVTGFAEGLAIHLLLLGAGVLLFIKHLSAGRVSFSSGSAHHRALIPTPPPELPKGGIALTPRTSDRDPRDAPAPAPPVLSERPSLRGLRASKALPSRTPKVAAG